MSELAEENVEKFIKCCRTLIKRKIYEKDEIKKMVKKRRDLEYLICSRIARLDIYEKYIDYELKFWEDLNKRLFTKNKYNQFDILLKLNEKRINLLFRRTLNKFKNNIKLWEIHFKFCVDSNNLNILESTISNCIRLNFSDCNVWLIAAKWIKYLDEKSCKKLLEKAIKLEIKNDLILINIFELNLSSLINSIDFMNELYLKAIDKFNFFLLSYNLLIDNHFNEFDVLNYLEKCKKYSSDIMIFIGIKYAKYDLNKTLIIFDNLICDNKYGLPFDIYNCILKMIMEYKNSIIEHSKLIEWVNNKKSFNLNKTCVSIYISFCNEFNTCVDKDIMDNIKNIKYNNYIELLKCICRNDINKNNIIDIFLNSLDKYCTHIKELIESFTRVIIEYKVEYLEELIEKILKYKNKYTVIVIDNSYEYIVSTKGYNYIKLILKNNDGLTSEFVSLNLIKNIINSELIILNPDIEFIRHLLTIIFCHYNKDIEYWIIYYHFERKVNDMGISIHFDLCSQIINDALFYLPSDKIQSFYHGIYK